MAVHRIQGAVGGREMFFETGKLAKQAGGAVIVGLGETQVLVTATAGRNPKEQLDFFPLTVDVEERMYAAGKIPGGFFRREGRPSETAILTARLVDRPLRPSFPKGLRNEIHIVATIMSADMENNPDVLAINGASMAVLLAGIPFSGPVGGVRLGRRGGEWIVNPTFAETEECSFDMVVAGRQNESGGVDILMVEAEATANAISQMEDGAPKPTEEAIGLALEIAKSHIATACELQRELLRQAEVQPRDFPLFAEYGEDVAEAVRQAAEEAVRDAITIADKAAREARLDEIKADSLQKVVEQLGESLAGRERETPPVSTGETGFMRGPKRREIGHGALAERALLPVIPSREEFPYALRLVSEVLSSNGSTSMASVCASTLSLMDAGVPIKAPVGGIAMGLVSEGGEYVTLTDILGAEDAYGDMDFKVAGTREFVTALQLDTKLTGIPSEVLINALTQARDARMVVLDVMQAAIEQPREQVSMLAPRVHIEQIPVAKLGELIGPKGKRINEIQAASGADISIEDDGRVFIGATNGEQLEIALNMIREQMNPVMPQVGERYLGTVVKTTTFGAFISLTPGKDGLLHISKLGRKGQRVRAVEDVVNVGDKLLVEVTEVDRQGRISLRLAEEEHGESAPAGASDGGDGGGGGGGAGAGGR